GTAANGKLLATLSAFLTCTPAVTKAKQPPTARLVPFANSMKSACKLLTQGANGVAHGIATLTKKKDTKLGTLQLQTAIRQFQLATTKRARARKRLLAIGGKRVFGASRRNVRLAACRSYPRSRPGAACSPPTSSARRSRRRGRRTSRR